MSSTSDDIEKIVLSWLKDEKNEENIFNSLHNFY